MSPDGAVLGVRPSTPPPMADGVKAPVISAVGATSVWWLSKVNPSPAPVMVAGFQNIDEIDGPVVPLPANDMP